MSQGPIDFNGLDTGGPRSGPPGCLDRLANRWPAGFHTLKKRLEVADGALGLHLQKLEAIGYVRADTVLHGRRPRTIYHLTAAGRRALAAYLDSMRQLLDAVAAGARGEK